MVFRIGEYILTPNFLILPFALLLFVLLATRGLQAGIPNPRIRRLAGGAAATGAVAGAALLGGLSSLPEKVAGDWFGISLSTFGFYWGALGCLALFLAIRREPILERLDAIVSAMLAAGILARVGCLYAGCCRGIEVSQSFCWGWQPFRLWPLYDIGALLLTAVLISAPKKTFPGLRCALFLVVYGLLRFLIEFLRKEAGALGPFTIGHGLAGIQLLAGVAMAWYIWRIGKATIATRR